MAFKAVDPGGEWLLPLASSMLFKLKQAGLVYASQSAVFGGYSVQVRRVGNHEFIRITASKVYYDFYTSEHVGYDVYSEAVAKLPVQYHVHIWEPGSPGNLQLQPGTDVMWSVASGSVTRVVGGKLLPLMSLVLTPPGTGDKFTKWALLSDPYAWDQSFTPSYADVRFQTGNTWQNQGIDEPVWGAGQTQVYSSRGISVGRGSTCNYFSAGVGGLTTAVSRTDVFPIPVFSTDIGKDVRATKVSAHSKLTKAPTLSGPQSRYWRRAAVALSDAGNPFFINTDNYGRVQVYRADGATPDAGETSVFTEHTPPYPSWVSLPALDNDAVFDPCWVWAFNSDCTRMAAAPYKSVANANFYNYRYSSPTTIDAHTYSRLSPASQAAWVPSREDTPGVVEFSISITESEGIHTVKFTLLYSEHYETSRRYPLEVAYASSHVEGVTRNTLLVSGLECSVPAGGYEAAGSLTRAVYMADPGLEDRMNTDNAHLTAAHVDGDTNAEGYIHGIQYMRASYVVDSITSGGRTRLREFKLMDNCSLRFIDYAHVAANIDTQTVFANKYSLDHPEALRAGVGFAGSEIDPSVATTSVRGASDTPVRYAPYFHRLDPHNNVLSSTGSIRGVDLSSLSFVYVIDDAVSFTQKWSLDAFGTRQADATRAIGTDRDYPPWLYHYLLNPSHPRYLAGFTDASVSTQLPQEVELRVLKWVTRYALETSMNGCLFTHPKGHWACSSMNGRVPEFDIIQPRNGKRTSHRAAFNSAFGQTRAYDFYQQPYQGSLNTEGGVTKANSDVGDFGFIGKWAT